MMGNSCAAWIKCFLRFRSLPAGKGQAGKSGEEVSVGVLIKPLRMATAKISTI